LLIFADTGFVPGECFSHSRADRYHHISWVAVWHTTCE